VDQLRFFHIRKTEALFPIRKIEAINRGLSKESKVKIWKVFNFGFYMDYLCVINSLKPDAEKFFDFSGLSPVDAEYIHILSYECLCLDDGFDKAWENYKNYLRERNSDRNSSS